MIVDKDIISRVNVTEDKIQRVARELYDQCMSREYNLDGQTPNATKKYWCLIGSEIVVVDIPAMAHAELVNDFYCKISCLDCLKQVNLHSLFQYYVYAKIQEISSQIEIDYFKQKHGYEDNRFKLLFDYANELTNNLENFIKSHPEYVKETQNT